MISTVTVSNIAILLFDTYRGRNLGIAQHQITLTEPPSVR